MRQADKIRAFAAATYIESARSMSSKGVSIRAGDVHRELGLKNAMPAVCSALGSNKFAVENGLKPIGRSGPSNGSNAVFDFEVEPHGHSGARSPGLAATQAAARLPRQMPVTQQDQAIGRETEQDEAVALDLSDALVLISCVKSKRSHAAEARDLYVSPLFTMARDLAEAQGAEFRILSARYGLVEPKKAIEPYEYSLNALGRADRRQWAQKILEQIAPLAQKKGRVVFFAGERYREYLIDPLRGLGVDVEVPMEGLRQGEQLSWLRRQL